MTERTRRPPDDRGYSQTERGPDGGVRPFLESTRAQAVRAKEFDRLATEVARLVAALELAGDVRPEVRRAPDRCIVQLGPVALTISWVRGGSEIVAQGRLLIIEWIGIVARGKARISERIERRLSGPPEAAPASVEHESVLRAAATGADDWLWQPENGSNAGYTSLVLAANCVDSLRRRNDRMT
jgi:hypothetical protein